MNNNLKGLIVLIKGGGEVASAVAHRLTLSGFYVCLTEIQFPLAVHRGTTFSEAVYDGEKTVEGLTARLVDSDKEVLEIWKERKIPLIVDPDARIKELLKPHVIVDARMAKRNIGTYKTESPLVIGLGPGFKAGYDVHLVVETYHSEYLGKVIIEGEAEKDTGIPLEIGGYTFERAIHAPVDGKFTAFKDIGDYVLKDDLIASIDNCILKAEISGVLRGILRNKVEVIKGTKVAEIDPTGKKEVCYTIRAKMRAIAGGVLEAIMMTYNR